MNESVSQIYVVDDDVSVREGVGRLLRSAGLSVKTFDRVQEVLANLGKEVPRCLVLDIQLPDIDGFELQEQLTQKRYTDPDNLSNWSWRHPDVGPSNESWSARLCDQAF